MKNNNNKKIYPSDITREQFERIKPILESARRKTKPRTIDLYHVFNAVLYLLKTGCQWRLLPKEYPKWRTVHEYFTIWRKTEIEKGTSILEEILKKISWRGETKQWSERENNIHNSRCTEC